MKILLILFFAFILNLNAKNIDNAHLSLTIVDLIPKKENIIFQKIIRKNYNLIEKSNLEKYGTNIKIKKLDFNLYKDKKIKKENVSVFLGRGIDNNLINLIIDDIIKIDNNNQKINYILNLKNNEYYYYELKYSINNKDYIRIYQFILKKINNNIFSF
jgi:hypothetical protein